MTNELTFNVNNNDQPNKSINQSILRSARPVVYSTSVQMVMITEQSNCGRNLTLISCDVVYKLTGVICEGSCSAAIGT